MSKLTKILVIVAVLILIALGIYFLSKPQEAPTAMDEPTEEFIENNTNISTSSAQLKTEDLVVGEGEEVQPGDIVTVHYLGTLENGNKFDSSYDRDEPFKTQIGVGNVIEGWDTGIVGMKVGGKRKLTIPPELGYGSSVAGPIPPNSTLIFEVELLAVQ